jgi:hypothetical protein
MGEKKAAGTKKARCAKIIIETLAHAQKGFLRT